MKKKTITIHQVRFEKAKLAKMDKKERELFFVLGHLLNDLLALHRIVLCCSNHPVEDRLTRVAGQCQALLAIRLMIGHMHEVWKVMNRDILSSPLRTIYLPLIEKLDPTAIEALENLKGYFIGEAKANRNVSNIRHNYAFHYGTHNWGLEKWEDADSDAFVFHLSPMRVNGFYEMSHEVITRNMLSATSAADTEKAFEQILTDTVDIATWLTKFLHIALLATVQRYSDGTRPNLEKKLEVSARNMASIWVPYFVRGKLKPSSR